ncbi:MAG TPA: hypothetical protein VJZ00_19655, partial [Thermoanaerobaculia bacterium]|nr:hypothetical protein [Thermoanaerobaculia bacterium]
DRVRAAGAKVILHSRLAKGWTPRTLKTLTHSEHPGTAVLWDDEYFEVVTADALPAGGVRYVLEKWREEHVMRAFVPYTTESEVALAEDYARAARQRRHSVLTRVSGVLLGHLPSPVQNHLANERGVSAPAMTLVSCIPAVALLGVCAYIEAGSRIAQKPSPITLPVWILAAFFMLESGIRFFVAMTQNRPMGSLAGAIVYSIFHALSGSRKKNLPKPFEEPGDGVFFMIPPPDDVALRDSLTMRGPMLTLLPAREQEQLARIGYNYRDHAFGLAWIILVVSAIGAATAIATGAVLSLIVAIALAAEQVTRLLALRRGPAGSVLGIVVRPFVRDLLARR